jgi:hypothetical protein
MLSARHLEELEATGRLIVAVGAGAISMPPCLFLYGESLVNYTEMRDRNFTARG